MCIILNILYLVINNRFINSEYLTSFWSCSSDLDDVKISKIVDAISAADIAKDDPSQCFSTCCRNQDPSILDIEDEEAPPIAPSGSGEVEVAPRNFIEKSAADFFVGWSTSKSSHE